MVTSNQLLTNQEVRDYGEIGVNFATCKLRILRQIERYEFRVRFGIDLYSLLLSSQIDYSTTLKWNKSKADYAVDDVVTYSDYIWKCIAIPTVGSSPSKSSIFWEYAPKFSLECYNELWCDIGLAAYLSNIVILRKGASVSVAFDDVGFNRKVGDGFRPADRDEIADAMQGIGAINEVILSNVDYYLKDNKETCEGYNLYLGNVCEVCNNSACSCDQNGGSTIGSDYIII